MPIFFALLGVGAVVIAIASVRKPTIDEATRAVRSWPGYQKDVVSGTLKASALDYVCAFVKAKRPVPRFILEQAMYEAAHRGDWKTFHDLTEAFKSAKPVADETEIAHDEQSDEAEASGQPQVIVGKNSPLQGVSNDEWGEFVEKLKTQDSAYRDPAHVGAFHHSTRRLEELGISPDTLADEGSQYDALERDMKDATERYKRMINEWAGDVIQLNGQATPITRSGLLGLIKSAGFEGAKAWLQNEGDRMKYPNTTAMFLKCNGCF